jgi:hypothetical protein
MDLFEGPRSHTANRASVNFGDDFITYTLLHVVLAEDSFAFLARGVLDWMEVQRFVFSHYQPPFATDCL